MGAIKFNNKNVESIMFNGKEVAKMNFNGVEVYTKKPSYTITNSTYYFAYNEETRVFTSNNQGVHSTNAETTLTFAKAYQGTITVNWTVSSESNYDKLTITYKGTTKVNAISGTQSGSFEISNIAVGDTLYFKYSKDGSANAGTDTATVQLIF